MENLPNPEENDDVGYHQSPGSIDPNDHSASETPVYSTMSTDSFAYHRTCSETSRGGFSDHIDETSSFCSEVSPSDWPVLTESDKSASSNCLTALEMKHNQNETEENLAVQEISEPELETMKERFSKLLLGEDMSGSGKGVCTAVTISNAITNLYATVFGQNLRLEPLEIEKKTMWKREMNFLLSVCDYIFEFIPKSQNLSNGATVEVMESRPRADIYINLPALRKLDSMLMEALDGFQKTRVLVCRRRNLVNEVNAFCNWIIQESDCTEERREMVVTNSSGSITRFIRESKETTYEQEREH